MKAPILRNALILERPLQSADGAGGFSESWTAVGTLWAEVLSGSGRDPAGEEVVRTSVSWRITVRGAKAGSDLRPAAGQRFREGMRVFTILAIAERDPEGRWLTCFCREEAAT